MDLEDIRKLCLELTGSTEDISWETNLCFCVGAKIYAMASLEGGASLSIKAHPIEYTDLIERDSIIPAPYLARHKWVFIQDVNDLPKDFIYRIIKQSYELVFEKLSASTKRKIAEQT